MKFSNPKQQKNYNELVEAMKQPVRHDRQPLNYVYKTPPFVKTKKKQKSDNNLQNNWTC